MLIKISHCLPFFNPTGGGIYTYIKSLLAHDSAIFNKSVISNLKEVIQANHKLLHIHDPKMLQDWNKSCPAVFTLHTHSTYCPSGTKYLSAKSKPCKRLISVSGCAWGHLVDGCGSKRPHKIVANISTSLSELKLIIEKQVSVIAVSNYSREQLLQHGLGEQQVTTVHHGVDLPNIDFSPITPEIHRKQRILFVGRIVPDKGLRWLLEALKQVNTSVQLDIAGEGWHRPELEKLTQKLDLSSRVVWHGWCTPERLNELYQESFALVFPSLWPEPAGLVSLEAYARFRPVIASNVGGIPEYVFNGKTGVLVPRNDVSALTQAIEDFAQNYEKCRDLGIQAHSILLEKFSMETHIHKLKAAYQQISDDFYR